MLPSSRALLSPLLLLIIAGSTGAFSSRQGGKRTPFEDVLRPMPANDDNVVEEDKVARRLHPSPFFLVNFPKVFPALNPVKSLTEFPSVYISSYFDAIFVGNEDREPVG